MSGFPGTLGGRHVLRRQRRKPSQAVTSGHSTRDTSRQPVRALSRSNTILVFISENGWLEGEHRLDGMAVPYEEAVPVPLIV
jgi:hypothetical protein